MHTGIVPYHRFGIVLAPLAQYPEGKGFHRETTETCVAPLEFDEAGKMMEVIV